MTTITNTVVSPSPIIVFIFINPINSRGTILVKLCAHLLCPGVGGAPSPRDPCAKSYRHHHHEKRGQRSRQADRPRARSRTDPQQEPSTSRADTSLHARIRSGPVSPPLYCKLLHKINKTGAHSEANELLLLSVSV